MSSIVEFAKKELDILVEKCGKNEESIRVQKIINEHILNIVKTFSKEKHTEFTAEYTLDCIERLLRFKPLTPLTGEKDEWTEVGEGVYQNKRCYNVFKEKDGIAHINLNCGKKKIEFPYIVEIVN